MTYATGGKTNTLINKSMCERHVFFLQISTLWNLVKGVQLTSLFSPLLPEYLATGHSRQFAPVLQQQDAYIEASIPAKINLDCNKIREH